VPDFGSRVDRHMRRWQEQRWILDAVIRTVGVEWDQGRIGYTLGPCGPEASADFALVRERIRKFADISREFRRAAERREEMARRHEREGHPVSARDSYFIASLLYGSAQWPFFGPSDEERRLDERKRECYAAYARLAEHPVRRVEIPFEGRSLAGWLHLPAHGQAPFPCVLNIPGMDTFKELGHALYGDRFQERGMACLALDGPGQGESLVRGIHVTEDNYADAGRAALEWLRGQPEIDAGRLAVNGRSFGSFWGTQVAAADPEVRACAVAYVCHEPGCRAIFETASPTFKLRFMYMAGYEDEEAFDRFAERLSLAGAGRRVRCPYLVVAGEEDELSPIEFTYELLREIPGPKELLLYQGERHSLHGGPASALGPSHQAYIADWLRDRLEGRPMEGSRRIYVDVTGREHVSPLP
jgi:fermentation-respiration switch protein FrsA (DUF1100 family)